MAEDRTAPAAETEENLSDILRIRREKLAELRANGKDPFVIRRFDKTHDFKTIRDAFDALEGSDVIVAGRILDSLGVPAMLLFATVCAFLGAVIVLAFTQKTRET